MKSFVSICLFLFNPFVHIVVVFCSEGKEVQIIHAIDNMYTVIKDESRQQIETVLSRFKNLITNPSKDIQIACAKFLLQASDNLLLHGERFASFFAKDLLEKVKDRDPGLLSLFL